MKNFDVFKGPDGEMALGVVLDGEEPFAVLLTPDEARQLMTRLAMLLADLGEGQHAYRFPVEAEAVDPPAMSPTGYPDLLVDERNGQVGMVFHHQWLGPVGLLFNRADFGAFVDGLASARDRLGR